MAPKLTVTCNWPGLPIGLKNGISARIGGKLIAGLGSAGVDLFALDITDKEAGWRNLAPFIGPSPSNAAAAVLNDQLYVFGGSGLARPDAAPTVLDTAFRYDPVVDRWEQLDTTTPVGLLGANALPMPDGRVAFIGGYNKDVFDTFLARITAVDKEQQPERWAGLMQEFMGQNPEAYRWNDRVLTYDPTTNLWGDLGENPYLPNTGAAVVEIAPARFVVVNGEVKPGLRTAQVKQLDIAGDMAIWAEQALFPNMEGVAGGYAGLVNGMVMVAGGTAFPGARKNADSGKLYAHEGLVKTWADAVFVLWPDGWVKAGVMPKGLAYGAAFTLDNGVLIVGGEDATGASCSDVFLLALEG